MSNYANPAIVALAQKMRRFGCSIRQIEQETGLSRETICKYAPRIPRPEAMRSWHARRRAGTLPLKPKTTAKHWTKPHPVPDLEPSIVVTPSWAMAFDGLRCNVGRWLDRYEGVD